MKLLTKEDVLGANDIETEVVEVPEWGGSLRVKSMSGVDRDEFDQLLYAQRRQPRVRNIRAMLVAMCAVDDRGERLFAASDVEALGAKSSAALERVHAVCTRLSKLRKVDVDDLEGNSDGTTPDSRG